MHIPDQHTMWNKKHAADEHGHFRQEPSPFAEIVSKKLLPRQKLLELGCGNGRDSVYFAHLKHDVTASDFSEQVIEQNKQLFVECSEIFAVMDISNKFPYNDNSFDVVYASLSIHYFTDSKTREIINEVRRVLKQGGIFAFACKTKDAVRTQHATLIEKDLYVGGNGHALHVFSKDYVQELLRDGFHIEMLDEVTEEYVGGESGIVRCIAKKN